MRAWAWAWVQTGRVSLRSFGLEQEMLKQERRNRTKGERGGEIETEKEKQRRGEREDKKNIGEKESLT